MISATLLLLGLALAAPETEQNGEKKYTLDFSKTTKEVKEGQDGLFYLHIRPASGFKVSAEAPLRIVLDTAGLELHKKKLGHQDASDAKSESPEFGVRFAAPAKGDQSIAVDATFFVCDDKICERKQEKVTVAINVTP